MGLFDWFFGNTNKAIIEQAQKLYRQRHPERDLRNRGQRIYSEMGRIIRDARKEKKAEKRVDEQRVVMSEQDAINQMKIVMSDARAAFRDFVMISHGAVSILDELAKRDRALLRSNFPRGPAQHLLEEIEAELAEIKTDLYNESTILRQQSGEN